MAHNGNTSLNLSTSSFILSLTSTSKSLSGLFIRYLMPCGDWDFSFTESVSILSIIFNPK